MPDQQQLYGLTDADRDLLRQFLDWKEKFRKETSPAPLKYRKPLDNIIAYTLDAIDGASGDITSGGGLTPGTGTAQRCYFDNTVWKPTSDNPYTVHNLGLTSYPENCQIQLAKVNGVWVIVELDTGVGIANEDGANGEMVEIEVYWGDLPSVTDSMLAYDMFNGGADITEGDTVRFARTNGQLECFKICTGTGGDSTITVNLTGEVTGTGTS